MDLHTSPWSTCYWPNSAFEKYECDKPFKFTIRVEDFVKLIGRSDNKDSVEMTSNEDDALTLRLMNGYKREFDMAEYMKSGKLVYASAAAPPDPQEMGWKDTVRAEVGMVTRIIVRFEGYTGRYVWHCHVLEHEDNEMMRPFEVVA